MRMCSFAAREKSTALPSCHALPGWFVLGWMPESPIHTLPTIDTNVRQQDTVKERWQDSPFGRDLVQLNHPP